MELHGKRVVVIDGTSGIGRAVAHESQALGASVVVASVVVRRAAPTRSKARADGGVRRAVCISAQRAPRRGSGEAMIMRIQTLVLAISDGRPANAWY